MTFLTLEMMNESYPVSGDYLKARVCTMARSRFMVAGDALGPVSYEDTWAALDSRVGRKRRKARV